MPEQPPEAAVARPERRRWLGPLTRIIGLVVLAGLVFFVTDDRWPRWFADSLPKADEILVLKADRKLLLLKDGKAIKTYTIDLGRNPIGHKTREGDSRTPEGEYLIAWRNPISSAYRSLHISYPNEADKAQAAARGFSRGGNITIHGTPNGLGRLTRPLQGPDWTDGCIAVGNVAMAEIWASVDDGTPIRIEP